jgi:hypothetical protein
MTRKIEKLSKEQIAAIRDRELAELRKASRFARRLMTKYGITEDLLEVCGRAPDAALTPAERETVAACRRVVSLMYAIGSGSMVDRRQLH